MSVTVPRLATSVTVERLSKQFVALDRPAVRDVSFVAPLGGITTLLGPSGSGKTTVLRMIAGLEEPDSGKVLIGGQDCTRIPVQKRGVGFVFQGYALFEHLSAWGNIAFGLKLQKMHPKAIADRVGELLALVQLENLGDRYPTQLSGGQRQRVAFARALATRPQVLLLDEPFGALDTRVRAELREWLRELHRKTHVTTLLVTHDQDEALELSQQVVVMNEGRVEQVGEPHEVYDRPASPFVASFVGAANVLHGQVKGGRAAVGALSFDAPAGALDGSTVNAFVRPHEVKIRKEAPGTVLGAQDVSVASIESLTRIGGYVRVNLRLSTAEAVSVQMLKAELDALGVNEGDRVMVDIGAAKIFMGDYSI
jgi:sulfate/thiosulfate transport system ATP-binding protein